MMPAAHDRRENRQCAIINLLLLGDQSRRCCCSY